MQQSLNNVCRLLSSTRSVVVVTIVSYMCHADTAEASLIKNLAPLGHALLGVAADLAGTDDHVIAHQGPLSEINDSVISQNLTPDAFIINGDGQNGWSGNGADTFTPQHGGHVFDYVGVLFTDPQYGVTSVRVQHYLANDGGWWGPTNMVAGGAPLTSGDLTSPLVQVTFNGGANWSSVGGVTSDYVMQYTDCVRGSGFPRATSGPLAIFTFPRQDGIDGIRLIGNSAGPADGNGFIGVSEFEAFGIAQELTLEVNTTTGMVRLGNHVQSTLSLDFYHITSASDSLDITRWDSLQNPQGNPTGFPSGNGSGNGWEELGNLNNGFVGEGYLQGSSQLKPGDSVHLGFLYAGEVQDLMLRYRTAAGQFVDGAATYAPGSAGDFDWDGDVDGSDFLAWQRGRSPNPLSAEDLASWRDSFGSQVRAQMTSVPEPNTVVMLLISAAASAANRTGTPRLCHASPGDRVMMWSNSLS